MPDTIKFYFTKQFEKEKQLFLFKKHTPSSRQLSRIHVYLSSSPESHEWTEEIEKGVRILGDMGVPCFIALCFIVPHLIALHECCVFYKWEARPSTSKNIVTCFITVVELNSGYLRHACTCLLQKKSRKCKYAIRKHLHFSLSDITISEITF